MTIKSQNDGGQNDDVQSEALLFVDVLEGGAYECLPFSRTDFRQTRCGVFPKAFSS